MQALLLMVFLAFSPEGTPPQAAAPEPTPPKRVVYKEPQFPALARDVVPPLQGIIVLEMVLNEEGRPVDIKVLRGMPLLDAAAIDAARLWRYEPTLVNGVATRVVVEEVVDMFPDQDTRARYWVKVLNGSKTDRRLRILSALRLASIGLRKKHVLEALRKATTDSDPDVSSAAARALATLEAQ